MKSYEILECGPEKQAIDEVVFLSCSLRKVEHC